jgi:hypothetical protein
MDRRAEGSQGSVMRGTPVGTHAAANSNDLSLQIVALQEASCRIRAALRLLAHALTSGEVFSLSDCAEAILTLLARARDWLAIARACHAQ